MLRRKRKESRCSRNLEQEDEVVRGDGAVPPPRPAWNSSSFGTCDLQFLVWTASASETHERAWGDRRGAQARWRAASKKSVKSREAAKREPDRAKPPMMYRPEPDGGPDLESNSK